MKRALKWIAVPMLCVAGSMPALAASPTGRLLIPDFTALAPAAADSVSITLDAPLLAFAARFLDGGDPDQLAVKEMIGGLQGIYVKSYTFKKAFAYPVADIEAVRKQLAAPGWQRIVQVRQSEEHTAVDIYVCQVQQKPVGLAIIASEPREFTIVNIVGSIDLDKLHRLEGRFGIPKLPPIEGAGPTSPGQNGGPNGGQNGGPAPNR
jgi:hypothetical protein